MRGNEGNRLKRFFAIMLAVMVTTTTVYYDGLIVNAEGAAKTTEEGATDVVTPIDGEITSYQISYVYDGDEVTLTGPNTVEAGKSFSFSVSEKTGYKIIGVETNSASLGITGGTYTVDNVTGDITVSIDSEVNPAEIFSLEVRFSYEDGNPVQEAFSGSYSAGYAYSVSVPQIPGFHATVGGNPVTEVTGILIAETVIDVVYKAADVGYTVNHRFTNIGSVGYTEETESLSGKAGSETNAFAKVREGFTPQPFEQVVLTQGEEASINIIYTRNVYPVSFEVDGGTYISRIMKEYQDTVYISSYMPTKVGYDFDGWYLDPARTQVAPATITITVATVLYAKWKEKTVDYTVIYWQQKVTDANDGNTSNNTYDYKESLVRQAKVGSTVSRTDSGINKTYVGFNLNTAKSVSVTVAPDGKTVLNVYYDRQVYTINFRADKDGYNQIFATRSGLYESAIGYWPNPDEVENFSETYWDFAGWEYHYGYSTTELTYLEIYDYSGMASGNTLDLYATFEYNTNESEIRHYLQKVDGSYTTTPYATAYAYSNGNFQILDRFEGYKAAQYRTGDRKNNNTWTWSVWKTVTSSAVDHEDALEIRHERKSYTLDFYNYNTPETSKKATIKFGAAMTSYNWTPGRPSVLPDYYVFGGWYESKECVDGSEFNFSGRTMPAKNMILYAKWTAPQVTVSFNSNGGSHIGSQGMIAGQAADEPEDPIKANHTFEGWYADAGLTILYDFGTPVPASGLTLYAKWKLIVATTYTIEYRKAGGGSVYDPVIRNGTVGKTYLTFAKSHSTYIADAVSKSITLSSNAAENVVVYNYCMPEDIWYKVVHQTVSGQQLSMYTALTNHSSITVNANPPAGYSTTQSSITKVLANELTEGSISNNVIRFNCELKRYGIFYTLNGGVNNPGNPSTYTILDTVVFRNPTKADYEFKGWYTTSTFTDGTQITGIPAGSTGIKRVYAKWEALLATILYKSSNTGAGTVAPGSETVSISGNASATGSTATIINSDYEFINWTDSAGNAVSDNQILKPSRNIEGKYTDETYTANFQLLNNFEDLVVTGGAWVYDGVAHGVTVTGAAGATITYSTDNVNYTATVPTITDVGTKTVYVKAEQAGYKTLIKSANIAVTVQSIKITSGSESRPYNGEALTVSGYTITGSFATDEGLASVDITGSITFPGVSANTIEGYTLKSNTKATNYAISYVIGELEVTEGAYEIQVRASNAVKTYDGLALKYAFFEPVALLMPGDTVKATIAGEITDVGTVSNNVVDVSVMHGTTDVTANYKIQKVPGTLTVNRREINVSANSMSKPYDGNKLEYNAYQIISGSVVSGDSLHITIEGEITNFGSTPNSIKTASVSRGVEDVTGNYEITKQNGTLSIEKRLVELTAGSDTKPYDGNELTVSGYEITDGSFVTGEGVASVTVSGSQLFVGFSDNTITGYTLTDVTNEENYGITTKPGTLTITEGEFAIQVTAASATKEYDQTELTKDEFSVSGNLASGDTVTATVSGAITDAGFVSNNITGIKVKHGTKDVTENYSIEPVDGTLTVTPRKVVLSANSASRPYNGQVLEDDDYYVIKGSFLGEDGVADTYIYGSQLFVGKSPNEFREYSLKDGTNSENYEISTRDGELEVTKAAIGLRVTSNSESKTYDGNPLENDGYIVSGNLAMGDHVRAKVEGIITNAGVSENRITDVKIFHKMILMYSMEVQPTTFQEGEEGYWVDVTENYVIEKVNGILTINGVPLKITANSLIGPDAITYGDDIPVGSFTSKYEGFLTGEGVEMLSGTLAYDTTYAKGSIPGNYSITPKGLTAKNYTITYVPGTMEVQKAELTVSANGVVLAYGDGAPTSFSVTYTGFTMSGDEGEFGNNQPTALSAVKEGEPVVTCGYVVGALAGEKFDIITDVSGLKSDRYTFKPAVGTLRVDYRPVTINVASATITEGDTPSLSYGVANLAKINGVKKKLNATVKLKSDGTGVGSHAIKVSNATDLLNKTFESYRVVDINNGTLTVDATGGGVTPVVTPVPIVTPVPVVTPVPAVIPTPAPAPAPTPVPPTVAAAEPVTIEDEETPLAETIEEDVEEIPDEEVPLAAPIEDCWIHWLILLLSLGYTIYSVVRIYFRNKKIKEVEDEMKSVEEA